MNLNLHSKTILTVLLTVLAALMVAGLLINWQVDDAFDSFLNRQDQFFVDAPRGGQRLMPDMMLELRKLRQEQEFLRIEKMFHAEVWRGIMIAILLAGVAAISIGTLYASHLTKPLRRLRERVTRLKEYDYQAAFPVSGGDEIADLGHAFNDLRRELSRVEELRKDAISDMAHEVTSPLQSLIGYTEGIETGIYRAEDKLTEIKQAVGRIERLVEDMRVFSHARAKARQIQIEAVQLRDFVAPLFVPLQTAAEEKELTFTLDIPESLLIQTDAQMLTQILTNLVKNAVEYTSEGSVTVTAEVQDEKQVIRVQDTGKGISAEDLPNIFERFYRADPSRDRNTGGTGLGLAIVKEYVDRLGWSIQVNSELGKGSLFTLTIPTSPQTAKTD